MQVNKNRKKFTEFEKEVRAKYGAKGEISKAAYNAIKESHKDELHIKSNNLNLKEDSSAKDGDDNRVDSSADIRSSDYTIRQDISYRKSATRAKEFQPPTKPDFVEDDIAGPKFNDDIV